jgi:hypothetical protein
MGDVHEIDDAGFANTPGCRENFLEYARETARHLISGRVSSLAMRNHNLLGLIT